MFGRGYFGRKYWSRSYYRAAGVEEETSTPGESGAGAYFWFKYYSQLAAKRKRKPRELKGWGVLNLWSGGTYGSAWHALPRGGLAEIKGFGAYGEAEHGVALSGDAILLLEPSGGVDHGVAVDASVEIRFEAKARASTLVTVNGYVELSLNASGSLDHVPFVTQGHGVVTVSGYGGAYRGACAVGVGGLSLSASAEIYHDPDENFLIHVLPLAA